MSVHHLCARNCGGTACDAPLTVADLDDAINDNETAALLAHIERGPKVTWTTPLVIPLRSSWWSRLLSNLNAALRRKP
jgi:hypothetical protein